VKPLLHDPVVLPKAAAVEAVQPVDVPVWKSPLVMRLMVAALAAENVSAAERAEIKSLKVVSS
jgi:hypothetical protein